MAEGKKREVKANRGQLHKALNEVLRDLDEEELAKGCTIEVVPPADENDGITILVNWNS